MIFLHKNLLTFSGSSLNLRTEKKYIIELIPLKRYNKGLISLGKKKFKRCQNSFLKASKSIFKILPHLKPIPHLKSRILCGSFRRAPAKRKKMYYKVANEKDQMIFSHMVSFCNRENFKIQAF